MRWRTGLLLSIPILIGIACPFLAGRVVNYVAEREYAEASRQARAMGLPLTPREAVKHLEPGPDSLNAAEGVKEVLRTMLDTSRPALNEFQRPMRKEFKQANEFASKFLAVRFQAGQTMDWARVEQESKTFEPYLEKVERALERPDWNFKRNWDEGFAMLLPDLAHLRQMGRMLHLRALLQMQRGDFQAALRSVGALFRLGRHLQTEPMMIPMLVGVSLERVGLEAALDLARIRPLSVDEIATIRKVVDIPTRSIDWRTIWLVEGASTLVSIELFKDWKGLTEFGLKEQDGYAPISRQRILRCKTQVLHALMNAEREWASGPKDLEASVQITRQCNVEMEAALSDVTDVFSKLAADEDPSDAIHNTLEVLEAKKRLTSLALLVSSQPYGRRKLPPEALTARYADPFSGKPMSFSMSGRLFSLYSVGTDGKDDGGSEQLDENGKTVDIVVSFPFRTNSR